MVGREGEALAHEGTEYHTYVFPFSGIAEKRTINAHLLLRLTGPFLSVLLATVTFLLLLLTTEAVVAIDCDIGRDRGVAWARIDLTHRRGGTRKAWIHVMDMWDIKWRRKMIIFIPYAIKETTPPASLIFRLVIGQKMQNNRRDSDALCDGRHKTCFYNERKLG